MQEYSEIKYDDSILFSPHMCGVCVPMFRGGERTEEEEGNTGKKYFW